MKCRYEIVLGLDDLVEASRYLAALATLCGVDRVPISFRPVNPDCNPE